MNKLFRLLGVGAVILALTFTATGGAYNGVKAQAVSKYFLPKIFRGESIFFDDFADTDPAWTVTHLSTYGPTYCRHGYDDISVGRYFCRVLDNADRLVATPGWRPMGDFTLEADVRFVAPQQFPPDPPTFQTRNGLGIVFGGSDDWRQYYAFMLGFWGKQLAWAMVRFDGVGGGESENLSNYGGAPSYVKGWDGWNHMTVLRTQDMIYVYVNGYAMPIPSFQDGTYGTNRLVGLTVTSWEANMGKMEYDNFKLAPQSMPY